MENPSSVMKNVDVRSKEEKMTDVECRVLYNKIVAKMNSKNFKTTEKDKKMLAQLRECELYLKELSYYSDIIYQRQVKEGNDENARLLQDQDQEHTQEDYSFDIEEPIDGGE